MGRRAKQRHGADPVPPELAGRPKEADIAKSGDCPGTFRWGPEKTLPQLPSELADGPRVIHAGWMEYLRARGGMELVSTAKTDGSLIDGLSFSATLLMAAERLGCVQNSRTLRRNRNIVVMGAAMRAEQRIARDTNYFDEIAHAWQGEDDIIMWLVGPEVSSRGVSKKGIDRPKNLSIRTHRGTVHSLFSEEGGLHNFAPGDIDMFIGFNAGFGSFVESTNADLLLSWLDDLYFLAGSGAPVVFTCANDYGDVKGEVLILSKVIGARFLVAPCENPFSMATTLMSEGVTPEHIASGGTGWSRGNAFWYAVQGVDPRRQRLIAPGTIHVRAQAVMNALRLPDVPMESMLVSSINDQSTLRNIGFDEALKQPAASSEPEQVDKTAASSSSLQTDIPSIDYELHPISDGLQLELVMSLPTVLSMDDIVLDVAQDTVRIEVPLRRQLQVNLPSKVDTAGVLAKFSKRRSELKLTLPVA